MAEKEIDSGTFGIGVAAIPSASLVAIAIGLILAVDRVLDMCRTSVNVFSDSCGAVIIARRTGEDGVLGEAALAPAQTARPGL